jgi:hypothetical protein
LSAATFVRSRARGFLVGSADRYNSSSGRGAFT